MFIFAFFVLVLFILAAIKKPAVPLPNNVTQGGIYNQITCAPPSGDTFPPNVPTIAAGITEPTQGIIAPYNPSSSSHVLFPVDAPPPFSLIRQSPVIVRSVRV
jgi:hypothetical protein